MILTNCEWFASALNKNLVGMGKTIWILVFSLAFSPLFSLDLPFYYLEGHRYSCSDYEKQLIDHVKESLEKSMQLQSKLSGQEFEEIDVSKLWRKSYIPHYHLLSDLNTIPYYHLLNNLCAFPGASHLHVGLLAGDSYIAALYGNQFLLEQQIGIERFRECPQAIFSGNCKKYLDSSRYQVIKTDCFSVDKTVFKSPIDIYFYDADHSLLGHEKAITYYDDIFADVFILVIDDWHCPWIRGATFKAFSKLNYSVLYENMLPPTDIDKGQYIAVIRKGFQG
jgi:hypothetical protein